MVFCKDITCTASGPTTGEKAPPSPRSVLDPELTPTDDTTFTSRTPAPSTTLSEELTAVKAGKYSAYATKTLGSFAGWSYSDFETFKDMASDQAGPNVESIEIQVKNEPLLVQATAQMIRTSDKKVAIIVFRGTEMTNLVNWMTDAVAKKSDFYKVKKDPFDTSEPNQFIQVHTGFKTNFEKVWFGQKGILMHLLHPEMMRKDYDYSKPLSEQRDSSGNPILSEQDELEAIYVCGHSLGGAMAFLAGLYLGAFATYGDSAATNPIRTLFEKLKGVYTYGAPMVVDDHDRTRCQYLCGDVTFRHVYYNDIVPHLPPLSTGGFDHVGKEYRYHPQEGWQKREGGFFFKSDRTTQVVSIAATAPFGFLDGVLDNINWFNFFRGNDRDWPVIGFFSRGYLKMPWSFHDHSPVGYISSLMKLSEDDQLNE